MTEAKLVTVYRCADGRDFPVEWPSAEQAAKTWFWDPEHNARPWTPLDQVIWSDCAKGGRRARREAGHPERPFLGASSIFVHGFAYFGETPDSEEEEAQRRATNQRLMEAYGDQLRFWQDYCLPRIVRTVEELRDGDSGERVDSLIEKYGYGFEHTFIFIDEYRSRLENFLSAQFGEEGQRLAVELMQGYPNATLEADQALWELAGMARERPALRALLLKERVPSTEGLGAAKGGAEALEALSRFMERYGWRTLDWDPSSPTWRERPEAAFQVIRSTIENGLPAPAEMTAAAAARREGLIADLESRLSGEPEKLKEFRALLRPVSMYLSIKEGRALWQLTLNGVLRHALLNKGKVLAANGAIDDAEDVFYLLPDEIEAGLAAGENSPAEDFRRRVEERRAERERWLGVVPPARIGGEAPGPPRPELFEGEPGELRELKGVGASGGVVTGRARVIASFEEYNRLQPGEILVCSMTTPAWTPLFAVAAAVVSDGGGLLSHTAIAAREYGIPAVVGTRFATQRIRDGAMVTVDGAAGLVIVER